MTRPMPGPPECLPTGFPHERTAHAACLIHARSYHANSKRLTDAECAAEYWRASNMCWRTDALGLEDPAGTDLEYESYTWLAFATCPHALEEA